MKTLFNVIGIMSGTSMDGVDLAFCELSRSPEGWSYRILAGETIPYPEVWRVRLSQLPQQPIHLFPKTSIYYGRYLGRLVNSFQDKIQRKADFISSHGHTIFHRPEEGYTAQVGDGAAIAAETGLPVVSDFRVMDVALGGQGAPLVPIGDQLLFPQYQACLNLGGISNISYEQQGRLTAFDISPCNIVLNRVARWLGQPYDKDGRIAASADPDAALLKDLNGLAYYHLKGSKSLGREWINEEFWPVVKSYPDISEEEKMATLAEHIAIQIGSVIQMNGFSKVLVTGGGAYNQFLTSRIAHHSKASLTIPEPELVDYKEALIFALLGVLRVCNSINVRHTVTGASRDQVSGALHGNFQSLID